jgi:hypothetical protein
MQDMTTDELAELLTQLELSTEDSRDELLTDFLVRPYPTKRRASSSASRVRSTGSGRVRPDIPAKTSSTSRAMPGLSRRPPGARRERARAARTTGQSSQRGQERQQRVEGMTRRS